MEKNKIKKTMEEVVKEAQVAKTINVDIDKHHSFTYKYNIGETVYVAKFESKNEGDLFSTIQNKFRWRPVKGVIKEVVWDGAECPKYRLVSDKYSYVEYMMASNYEDCRKLCDAYNLE